MRNDFNNWMPLSVAEIYSLYSKMGIQWGIAGGWALDLHLRKQIGCCIRLRKASFRCGRTGSFYTPPWIFGSARAVILRLFFK